jgi:hypothetical protein
MSFWPFGKSKKEAVKKFNQPLSTAVFTTKFVIDDHKDITYVTHEADGAWQFLSDDDFDDIENVAKSAGLGDLLEIDPTLLELADMPVGHYAIRDHKEDMWVVKKVDSPL